MVGRTNVGGGGGSSNEAYAYIQATYPSGSTCTATNGVITLNAPDTSGLYVFSIPQPSSTPETWSVSCTNGTKTVSQSFSIENRYQVELATLRYSRVPEGYQEIEYLESSGTQYIKTLHSTIQYNEQVEIDYMVLSNLGRALFGFSYGTATRHGLGRSSSSGSSFQYVSMQQSSSGSSSVDSLVINSIATLNTKVSAIYNNSNHEIVENNTILTTTTPIRQPANTLINLTTKMPIFCQWDYNGSYQANQMSTARIYKWTRTDISNNTIVEDLVPCRRTSNDTLGMYDLISDTFITNSGTGTFVAGPNI